MGFFLIWRHSTVVSGRYVAPAPLPLGPLYGMFGGAQSRSGCGDQQCVCPLWKRCRWSAAKPVA